MGNRADAITDRPSELLLWTDLVRLTVYVRLWHIEEREEGARATGDEEGEWENGERLTAAASQPVH